MGQGKLIVFEGVDGSGKTSQVKRTVEYLRSKYGECAVVQTKDPGGTKLGACIRQMMYVDVPTHEMAPGVVDVLFLASHVQNYQTVIKPAVDLGKVVVCDRWFYSQEFYAKEREVPRWASDAYRYAHGPAADLVILLHGNVSTLLERARSRETETHQSAKTWNDLKKLERIQKRYLDSFEHHHDWRFVCVDGLSEEGVWNEVKHKLDDYLVGKGSFPV